MFSADAGGAEPLHKGWFTLSHGCMGYGHALSSLRRVIRIEVRNPSKKPVDRTNFAVRLTGIIKRIKDKENKCIYPRHGKRWTPEDNTRLMVLFASEKDIKELATNMERTPKAVAYQISKLLLEESMVMSRVELANKYDRTEKEIGFALGPLHQRKM